MSLKVPKYSEGASESAERSLKKSEKLFTAPSFFHMEGEVHFAVADPFAGWKGAIWVHCERCKQDRKLAADVQVPQGFWYCEFNPDASAERCLPSANVPLRVPKTEMAKTAQSMSAKTPGEASSCFDPLRYNSLKFGSESSS